METKQRTKFRKAEIKKFKWTEEYIISELKTGRHISACLGSAGLTFLDDIQRFIDYLSFKGNKRLKDVIDRDKELTQDEMSNL